MYSVEKRTRKWFDVSVDGMDFEDYFVILDVNGKEVAEVYDEALAHKMARKFNEAFFLYKDAGCQ